MFITFYYWAGIICIGLGFIFVILGSIGVVRLPDFYTRAHAATKPDTLGLILVMSGLILHHGLSITSIKLAAIAIFVAFTNPAAAHALGRAAVLGGIKLMDFRHRNAKQEQEGSANV